MEIVIFALLLFIAFVAAAFVVKMFRVANRGHRAITDWLKS